MSRTAFSAALVLAAATLASGCTGEAAADYGERSATASTDPALAATIAAAPTIKVYKSPTCGCCSIQLE